MSTIAARWATYRDNRREALKLSSRLGLDAFGVGLGRKTVLVDSTGARWVFVVDFLRPTNIQFDPALAVSGLAADGTRPLLFLGKDDLTLERDTGSGAEVVHLAPLF